MSTPPYAIRYGVTWMASHPPAGLASQPRSLSHMCALHQSFLPRSLEKVTRAWQCAAHGAAPRHTRTHARARTTKQHAPTCIDQSNPWRDAQDMRIRTSKACKPAALRCPAGAPGVPQGCPWKAQAPPLARASCVPSLLLTSC